jgi:hypothetical protein
MQGDPFVIMLRFWERDICSIYSQGMNVDHPSECDLKPTCKWMDGHLLHHKSS